MNWNRLKDMMCPSCQGTLIVKKGFFQYYHCSKNCGFNVSSERFDEILENLYRGKKPSNFIEADNLAALNNFGHREMTEDFSDSPHLNV